MVDKDHSTDKLSVSKYKGTDFSVWKVQIESLLVAKGWDVAIKKTLREIEPDSIEKFETAERNAKSLLLMSLDNKYVKLVLQCSTAKTIWDRLLSIHEQKSITNQVMVQQLFFDLKMMPNEKAQDFVARAESLAGQLNDINIPISEQILVAKIVSGLGNDYRQFMSNWLGTHQSEQTIDVLLARLMSEEQLNQQFKNKEDNVALNVQAKQTASKNKSSNFDKTNTPCFYCKELGHWKRECPKLRKTY